MILRKGSRQLEIVPERWETTSDPRRTNPLEVVRDQVDDRFIREVFLPKASGVLSHHLPAGQILGNHSGYGLNLALAHEERSVLPARGSLKSRQHGG